MSTVAGGGGGSLFGYVDAVGAVARFNAPNGILHLSTGDLVVADQNNNIIRKITSSGMPTLSHIATYFYFSSSSLVLLCR